MHLSSGRKENEVPYLNRKDLDLVTEKTGYYTRPNNQSNKKKSILDPIGIKDINLKLVVPKQGITADFDPSRIIVDASLFYGNVKLSQKQTQSVPLVKDIRVSLKDTKTYEISLVNDNLLFDIPEIDLERDNVDKDVFTLIIIKYQTLSKHLKSC